MDDFATGYIAGQGENNGGGFGGSWGEGLWAIIILAMLGFGNGWGGFGGGINSPAGQGAITRADLCSEFSFNNLNNAVRDIQNGICDSTYSLNNTMTNGFHGVDNAVCQLGYNTQAGFNSLASQLASCCCETQGAIKDVRYDLSTQACDTRNTIQNATRDIIDNQNANYRGLMDFMVQSKIDALQAENQTLKLQASQSAQNNYIAATLDAQTAELVRRCCPTPVPSYQVPAPYPYNCGMCG